MFAAGKTAAVSGAGPDDKFNYVTMLLHGDGTNGAQNNTFIDSSSNGFTITRNGNTTQGSFSPYGSGWSNFFDGATATRLTLPSNAAFAFGTGAYTIEAWINLSAYAAGQGSIFDSGNATGALDFFVTDLGALGLGQYGVGNFFASASGAVPLNAWTHVAIVRSSTSTNGTTIYINGSVATTGTDGTNWTVRTTPSVGGINLSGYSTNGYISNLRVVKGTAVYTAAFTPPTTPLTAITNTSLLTCQSNRFIDNSSNAFAITVNGTPSVQRFNPFGTSTAYSTSVIGGSGYFDGSGDYLSFANNTAVEFGTGDYTVEFWAYRTVSATQAIVMFKNNAFVVNINASGGLYVYDGNVNQAGSARLNTWNHYAACRASGTLKLYVNGVEVFSTASSANWVNDSTLTIGVTGSSSTADPFTGYLSNLRIVKGTAVYTSAFTPPTAPLSAISGTGFLANFTNGAIFDNAMMNDLETVGNAQISTSVKKYGTGSLAFDGTGDRLVQNASPQIAFGTGDFTIEAWIYSLDVSDSTQRGWLQTSSTAGGLATGFSDGVTFVFGTPNGSGTINAIVGGTNYASSGGAVSSSTWTHIAVTRASGAVKLFVNGTSVASGTGNTTNLSGQFICIGGYYSTAYLYNGYIDDLRITKGYARYTANFTAPTSALSDTGPY